MVLVILVVERLKCTVNAKELGVRVFQITKITEDSDSSFAVSRNGLLLGDSQGRTAEVTELS